MGFLLNILMILLVIGMAIYFGKTRQREEILEKAIRNIEENTVELRKLQEEVRQIRQEQEKMKREKES